MAVVRFMVLDGVDFKISNEKANKPSVNAVKLRLSSGDRRLPVIVLHWSNSQHGGSAGQLFIYGGDDIGSEEVLTILNLDFSSGLEAVKCVKRLDLTLNGSYADIELVRAPESSDTTLFVLSNPGQLHVYDDDCLSGLASASDMKHAVNAVQCPVTIPTVEPYMTVSKLFLSRVSATPNRQKTRESAGVPYEEFLPKRFIPTLRV